MKYIFSESQLRNLIDKEIDERSRTLANTRKKRLFPKNAMMSNPDRFKEYDKEVKNIKEGKTNGFEEFGNKNGWCRKNIKQRKRKRWIVHVNISPLCC